MNLAGADNRITWQHPRTDISCLIFPGTEFARITFSKERYGYMFKIFASVGAVTGVVVAYGIYFSSRNKMKRPFIS
jgi:hypothetical protein